MEVIGKPQRERPKLYSQNRRRCETATKKDCYRDGRSEAVLSTSETAPVR